MSLSYTLKYGFMGVSKQRLVSSFFFLPDLTFYKLAGPSCSMAGCYELSFIKFKQLRNKQLNQQKKFIKGQSSQGLKYRSQRILKHKGMMIQSKKIYNPKHLISLISISSLILLCAHYENMNDSIFCKKKSLHFCFYNCQPKILCQHTFLQFYFQIFFNSSNLKHINYLMNNNSALSRFRQLLAQRGIDVYVLPRTDEHQSQYLCACDQRVAFVSGFKGSNALAVISQTQALLWTDGRYFLQAEKQLEEGWQMRKMIEGQKRWFQHISSNYPSGTKVQIDGRLITGKIAVQRKKLFEDNGFLVNFAHTNLVDQIWQSRPPSSATHIFVHEQWAGKSLTEKILWVRNNIKEKNGEAALFTDLGQIAWLLNLRSGEIPYNPFFKSVLLVTIQGGSLFLPENHPSKDSEQVKKHLEKQNIVLKQYDPQFPERVLCLSNQLNYYIYSQIKVCIQWDGIGLYRAVRSEKQINGFRRCHLADGIAMAKFWAWRSSLQQVGQYQAAKHIDNLRKQQKDNRGLSFDTISGGGPNGAIIHYKPTKQSHSIVKKDMIHLVDSGGQYLDGTTDVTRAFHFGNPTSQEKESFTRVLLGNLDVQRLKWPLSARITGAELDVLARRHLWANNQDYMHGTGHGVGYYGGVHEGPVGISKYNKVVYEKNMIVTNQPGYYENGKYGIRIENMLVVVERSAGTLGFQNLTLCPYDKNLLDFSILSQSDKEFINDYHKRIWETLSPHLGEDEKVLNWLRESTNPI